MNTAIILGAIGTPQIILVVVVVLLLFGGKKIPELMKGLGSGIKEFKDASKGEGEEKAKDSVDNVLEDK
ncbi:twin-arginine translocase TatA/TatE family subunit [Flavobacteriales bacterium]|jgi:sec-independent protein translocase protein TatA|nr:twin-arginine translocase TatA/TatE family subunit [Flavobacteriales bacterium]MDC1352964.1 twin-arginine translocase TatA/TatE family subunit [Flavobacteriales bacterium]MDG1176271.1 twin-arginine translocase TatA/TatE family subunit [Flavobacteriales bacterium]|tara:strand:- start:81 stop:287 length:207 start_codon:yes stop_codon:yes gene_type:complete